MVASCGKGTLGGPAPGPVGATPRVTPRLAVFSSAHAGRPRTGHRPDDYSDDLPVRGLRVDHDRLAYGVAGARLEFDPVRLVRWKHFTVMSAPIARPRSRRRTRRASA